MISADQWRAYNEAVESIRSDAASEVERKVSDWLANEWDGDVASARDAARRIMSSQVAEYDRRAAALAADWYDSLAREAGATLDRAVTAVTYTKHDIDNLAHYQATKLAGDVPDVDEFARMCGEFAANDAMRSLNRTILKNAKRDGGRGVRFARVTSGRNTCAFCLMLAGRGAVYHTRKTAGEFDHWHRHCTCKVVPCFSGNRYEILVEGHDPAKIEERLKQVEAMTGTNRGTREFTREVALRDHDWLFGDEIEYEISNGGEPDEYEEKTASVMAARGIKSSFQPRSLHYKDRRADTLINGEKWEFKNPRGNGKLTVYNQFKSVVYGQNKHERNPQANNLVISNIRSEMRFEKMVSDVRAVMDSDEFPEILNVLVVGIDGKTKLMTKSQ